MKSFLWFVYWVFGLGAAVWAGGSLIDDLNRPLAQINLADTVWHGSVLFLLLPVYGLIGIYIYFRENAATA